MKPWMLTLLFLVALVVSASPAKAEDPKPSTSIAAAPAIAPPVTPMPTDPSASPAVTPAREQDPMPGAAAPATTTTVITTTVTAPAGASTTTTQTPEPVVAPMPEITARAPGAAGARLLVDDFESEEIENKIGGRSNVFQKAPSKAMVSRRDDVIEGRKTRVLMLRYDKQAEGGPYGLGGWCGYYTLLKKPAHLIAPATGGSPLGTTGGSPSGTTTATGAAAPATPEKSEDEYLDATGYTSITFWVRGEQGGEAFMIGLADRHWDKIGDSVKSEVIGRYLPAGRITTTWQKAVIPLEAFFVDYAKLGSIAISFEADAFPDGKGAGTLYLDDLALE